MAVIRTQPGTSPRSGPRRASLRRMGQSGQGMGKLPSVSGRAGTARTGPGRGRTGSPPGARGTRRERPTQSPSDAAPREDANLRFTDQPVRSGHPENIPHPGRASVAPATPILLSRTGPACRRTRTAAPWRDAAGISVRPAVARHKADLACRQGWSQQPVKREVDSGNASHLLASCCRQPAMPRA
jgi:hypothetical protein